MILSLEVDNKIVQKVIDELLSVFHKYAALNVIQGSEQSPDEGQDRKRSEKKNPALNQILELVTDTYRDISLNQRTVKLGNNISSKEGFPVQKNKLHCICCRAKVGRTSSEAGVLSKSEDAEIILKQVKEAIAEFECVVRKFQCFRLKYSKLNQLLQIVENALTNATELVTSTTSIVALSEFHCKCCVENHKRNLCSSGKYGNEETSKKVKVADGKTVGDEYFVNVPPKDDDISSEEKVFAIDLVFEQILQSVPTRTLITGRLVNNVWNSKCTKILLKKQSLKTNIIFGNNPDPQQSEDLEAMLKILTTCKNKRKKFPSTDFRFFGGPLNHQLFQIFINKFGTDFKSCSFDFDLQKARKTTKRDITLMKTLLTVQLPNIEKLIIKNHPGVFLDDLDMNISILPQGPTPNTNTNLKFFDVGQGVPLKIFEIILQVATSLQEIKWDSDSGSSKLVMKNDLINNSLALLPSLTKFNKLNLIQSVGIQLDNYNFTDTYGQLANYNLAMKKMALHSEDSWVAVSPELAVFGSYLSRILNQCEDTLSDLSLTPLEYLPFRIPILSKLETLTLCRAECTIMLIPIDDEIDPIIGFEEKYFPEELRLSQWFPNLKRLNVKFANEHSEEYLWERNFNVAQPKTDVHLNVEELFFSDCPPLSWLENFTQIFPNLTTLTLRNQRKNIEKIMQIICKFQKLRNLILGYDVNYEAVKFPALDTVFTGFTPTTCSKLFEQGCKSLDDDDLKEFRINNSILDIKNLRYLKLILNHGRFGEKDASEKYNPLMTHVSGAFAFALCPNLQVELDIKSTRQDGIKLGTGLDTLFLYVHSAQYTFD